MCPLNFSRHMLDVPLKLFKHILDVPLKLLGAQFGYALKSFSGMSKMCPKRYNYECIFLKCP
jgi:hypothetical protein